MRYIITNTFRTLIREKILYNVFGVTLLLLFFGYLASLLVFGSQYRVMLELGLMVNSISIFGVSLSIGSRFFRQEIENKSIYLFLVRPISRGMFFLGRFLGMLLFVALNFCFLSLILFLFIHYMGGVYSVALFQSLCLTLNEASIILAASILLGFWLRPGLVFMALFAMVFLGHNHDLLVSMHSNPETTSPLFFILSSSVPHLSLFLMNDRVFYEQALTSTELGKIISYGVIWLFMFLLGGNAVFSRKNL